MFARILIAGVLALATGAAGAEVREVRIAPGEHWWGVCNSFGTNMPFTAETRGFVADIAAWNYGGQPASLLLSDRGRVIHSAAQSQVTIGGGVIRMSAKDAAVTLEQGGDSLPAAYRFASAKYFPPSGKSPDPLFFSAPQYNTWMELTYNQNEKDILAYAQSMLDHGLPPGVLMIDDTWQTNYGVWDFDPRKFQDPKGMTDRLHAMGFKVLVWVIPFVSLDSQPYRDLTQHGRTYNPGKGGFVVDAATGAPAHVSWWNGYSALLDLTDPVGDGWFRAQLNRLRADYGVDGFKFDGGQFQYYAPTNTRWATHRQGATGAEQNRAYAVYGEEFPTSEHRCVWGMAGRPVMVRLPDKDNTWPEVRRLVPDMIAAGLLGYPFICPDMIGGGSWVAYLPGSKTPYDKELFVRSAQVHALCPMMQFSVSPWRLMKDDPDGQKIICDLVALRQKYAPRFVKLAEECGRTGEPMIRNLEYAFPNRGYAAVNDQFMMGDFLLVAPQLEKGATSREVAVPPGTWCADDGTVVVGPRTITVQTPLERLPHFERLPGRKAILAEKDRAVAEADEGLALVHRDCLLGRTTKSTPLFKANEEMVFEVALSGFAGRDRAKLFLEWKRTGDDGKVESGRVPMAVPFVYRTSLDRPGFVRLEGRLVDGAGAVVQVKRQGRMESVICDLGAGVDIGSIRPAVPAPVDFDAFWQARRKKLDETPWRGHERVEEIESPLEGVRVFRVKVPCVEGVDMTGYLAFPTTPGKYPACALFHGYGISFAPVFTQPPSAEMLKQYKDRLFLSVSAHGFELGREEAYYKAFRQSLRSNGLEHGFDPVQNADPEKPYYCGMSYRVMRALEYLKSRPEWNGKDLTVTGGSQGGMQAVWGAALDHDVSACSVFIPWNCDIGGTELGRNRGDWYVKWVPALGYYDTCNMAARIPKTCRVDVTMAGLGDYICPPTGVMAFYNSLAAPKSAKFVQNAQHGNWIESRPQTFTLEGDELK